jgi:hypothetical protein
LKFLNAAIQVKNTANKPDLQTTIG